MRPFSLDCSSLKLVCSQPLSPDTEALCASCFMRSSFCSHSSTVTASHAAPWSVLRKSPREGGEGREGPPPPPSPLGACWVGVCMGAEDHKSQDSLCAVLIHEIGEKLHNSAMNLEDLPIEMLLVRQGNWQDMPAVQSSS